MTLSWARPCLPPEAHLGHAHHGIVHSPRIHPVLPADMSVALLIELFIVFISIFYLIICIKFVCQINDFNYTLVFITILILLDKVLGPS